MNEAMNQGHDVKEGHDVKGRETMENTHTMENWVNIVVCGVGGNGVVLASRAIARAALQSGKSVRVGEVHGLAVRGGTVVSHVRIGPLSREGDGMSKGVIIPRGHGDLMVAFEPLEALRFSPFLRKGAPILLNEEPFVGVIAHIGLNFYSPKEEILRRLSARHKVYRMNASGMAESLGSIQMLNTVMMGVLAGSGFLKVEPKALEDGMMELVPPKVVEKNRAAFRQGMEAILKLLREYPSSAVHPPKSEEEQADDKKRTEAMDNGLTMYR